MIGDALEHHLSISLYLERDMQANLLKIAPFCVCFHLFSWIIQWSFNFSDGNKFFILHHLSFNPWLWRPLIMLSTPVEIEVQPRHTDPQRRIPPPPSPPPPPRRSFRLYKKCFPWIVPSIVVVNSVLFLVSMYINNCPHNSNRCIGKPILGRFAFQSTHENPLLGPSAATWVRTWDLLINLIDLFCFRLILIFQISNDHFLESLLSNKCYTSLLFCLFDSAMLYFLFRISTFCRYIFYSIV